MHMSKQKILALIPLVITAGILIYTWSAILFTDVNSTWMHYVGLFLYLPLPYLHFKRFKVGLLATGIYFVLGTINLFSLTPSIISSSFGLTIGPAKLWVPAFQPLSFGLLILYSILNFNSFVTIYVDYKVKDEPQ